MSTALYIPRLGVWSQARKRAIAGSQWLYSPWFDCLFLIGPPIGASVAAIVFHRFFERELGLPFWAWAVFLLLIDAGHIYGTLFRTYLSPPDLRERKRLLWVVPVAIWGVATAAYAIGPSFFWRAFAYAAVFHFIRQYYGFLMLYARKLPAERSQYLWLDRSLSYLAALYPVIWWHTHLPRTFYWFFDYTFIGGLPSFFEKAALVLYVGVAAAYLIKESILIARYGDWALPKQLVLLGTASCWYVGIVMFNNHLAFLVTSCVGHGVPYVALVWLYGHKRFAPDKPLCSRRLGPILRWIFSTRRIPAFLLFLTLAAFVQHGLWDALVWRVHPIFFAAFNWLPAIANPKILRFLVPLLSVPVLSHYALDGFIWRIRDRRADWRTTMLEGV